MADYERDDEFPRGYSMRQFLADEQAAEEAEAAEPIEAAAGGAVSVEWMYDSPLAQDVAVMRLRSKEGDIVAEAVLLGWQARELAELLRR